MLDVLLPLAAAGLDAWGVAAADRDRYLGVIDRAGPIRADRRPLADRGGAPPGGAAGLDRSAALREMTRRYVEHAHTGAPVHEWPVP